MRRFVFSALVGVRRRAALSAVTCPQRPVRRAIPWRAPCGRTGTRPALCGRLPASRPREPHHEAPRLARYHRYRQPVRLPHGTCERHEARVVVAPAGNLPQRPVASDRLRRLRKLVTHVIPVPHRASPLLRQRPRRVSGPSPRLGKAAAENMSKRRIGDAVPPSSGTGEGIALLHAKAPQSAGAMAPRTAARWQAAPPSTNACHTYPRLPGPPRRARCHAAALLRPDGSGLDRKAPVDGADAEDGAPAPGWPPSTRCPPRPGRPRRVRRRAGWLRRQRRCPAARA